MNSQAYSDPIYRDKSIDELMKYPISIGDGEFKDKVVLITGMAGGIGRATSAVFGRLGAKIFGCGRTASDLEDAKADLAKYGVECAYKEMSVRDPQKVTELIEAVWDRFGKLDIIINGAGGQFAAPALDITPKGWHAVVETILYGSWYVMQAAAKRWIAEGHPGSIVNYATIRNKASVGIPHTAAARAGQMALAETLCVEWAPYNIRINNISIGKIASPGLKNYPPEAIKTFAYNAMRRLGDVMDIAQAAAFLSSSAANFITGATLAVDGGDQIWGEYWPLGVPEYFKI